jgi:hypothetical protein
MNELPKLGRLEKVALRAYWKNEATYFTPWLAIPENLNLLSDTVGMSLELIETESSVGPFRADIICRDMISESMVLIENQLEKTDHTHLGQLLTYAAGLETVNIIWIAENFTEEHRATLDWLNRITTTEFRFFGIEVELWKIADSPPAPKFNIVAKPNDWSKATKASSRESSERGKFYKDFWSRFIEALTGKYPEIGWPTSSGLHWIRFIMQDTRFVFSYSPLSRKMKIFLLYRENKPPDWYRSLYEDSEVLNVEFGKAFNWSIREDGTGAAETSFDFDHENMAEWDQKISEVGKVVDQVQSVFEKRRSDFIN